MDKNKIEMLIRPYPVFQYSLCSVKNLSFSEKVRIICERECPRFGKSWSCPPAVGTIEECKNTCMSYESALVFTTLSEVMDIENLEETLDTRAEHENVTKSLLKELEAAGFSCMALSGESCGLCDTCTYPANPCRHTKEMLPCIESHGILVTEVAKKCSMDFYTDHNTVTWFGVIFLKDKSIQV